MNKVYGEMIQINETLFSEISKIAEKKANGIALSSYNDYDLGEYSRLSSLLKIYAKKDAIEDVMADIEEIRSSVKSLSDQKNRLEVVGNRNTYSNDRFNETLQDMKQVSHLHLYVYEFYTSVATKIKIRVLRKMINNM